MTHKYPDTSAPRIAVMAGSFNPFTLGHLSILKRGLDLFDKIIIMVGINASKAKVTDTDRLISGLIELLKPLSPRVEVVTCTGLTAIEAKKMGATALLRGVRSVADFEYERNMADINHSISGLDTVILMARPELAAVSSSVVRELESYGLDVSKFLPSPSSISN